MDDVELIGTIATVISTTFGIVIYAIEKVQNQKEAKDTVCQTGPTATSEESPYYAPCKKFANLVSEWFTSRFKKFEDFAKTDALRGSDSNMQKAMLERISREVDGFHGGIYIVRDRKVNGQHTPLAPEVPDIGGYVVSSRPYYDECQKKLRTIASKVFLSANRGVEILVVATPLFNQEGEFIGILDGVVDVIRAPFSDMAKMIVEEFGFHESHPKARLILIDTQKVVLGSSHGEVDGTSNVSSDPSVAELWQALSEDRIFARNNGAACRVAGTSYFAICYDMP